jgi:hypothetical protein
MRKARIRGRTIAPIVDSLALFWALAVGPLCWILRDGLGPDATDTGGGTAIVRFLLTFYWGPILAALVITSLLLHRLGKAAPPEAGSIQEAGRIP